MPSTPPVRTTSPPSETSRTTRRGVLTALGSVGTVAAAGCLGGDRDYDEAAGVASRTADWPTLGHGYSHTSYAPEETGPDSTPAVAWSHEVFPTGQPAVVGDRVLVPDGESLRCFALDDGTERWTYAADESAWTTPTVVGDRVYLAAGQVAWHHDGGGFVTGAPTVAHGSVIGAEGERVVAVDADTGTEEWSADVGGSPQRAAAVAGDTLYVGAFGAGVRAFRLSGGGLAGLVGAPRRWGRSLPGSAGEGVAVANGTVVAVGEGGEDYPSRVSALR
jgi:outer membrane protein assembly factor BamB